MGGLNPNSYAIGENTYVPNFTDPSAPQGAIQNLNQNYLDAQQNPGHLGIQPTKNPELE